jgi:serine/threonine-protein kinase HSL1, negative regulator of Swe1 kinase
MDRYYSKQRPPTRRTPLSDVTSRVNSPATPTTTEKPCNSSFISSTFPHNESLFPGARGGNLYLPGCSRVYAIVDDEVSSSNRNSTSSVGSGSKRKTHIGPWQLGKTIGRGGCSRVRAVRHSVTGQYGAAKIISKATAETVRAVSLANLIRTSQNDNTMSLGRSIPVGLEREIVIMKLLNHKNIVRLYDVWENRSEM